MRSSLGKVILEAYICSNSVGIKKNVAVILVLVLSLGTITAPILIFNKKGRYELHYYHTGTNQKSWLTHG